MEAGFYISRQKCEIGKDGVKHFFSKFVSRFDSLQEAMDALYKGARKHELKLEVDNTVDPRFGFCFWQIYVQVGDWKYKVTEETEESLNWF